VDTIRGISIAEEAVARELEAAIEEARRVERLLESHAQTFVCGVVLAFIFGMATGWLLWIVL